MSDEAWRSSYDYWKTRSDVARSQKRSHQKRYMCRDCGKTGLGVQWRFVHYHETYHCVVEDRNG